MNWNNIQNIFKKVYWNQKSYKFNDFEKHLDICCTKMQTSIINLTQKFRKKVRNAYVVYKIPKNRKQEFHNIWITNNIIKLESNIILNNKTFSSKQNRKFHNFHRNRSIQIFNHFNFSSRFKFEIRLTTNLKQLFSFFNVIIWVNTTMI